LSGPRDERMVSRKGEATELILETLWQRLRPIVLVAAGRWITGREVGEPVFLVGQGVDALQAEGDGRLLVGLHLRQVDDDVGRENGARHGVLVPASRMVLDGGLVVAPMKTQRLARGRIRFGESAPVREIDRAV